MSSKVAIISDIHGNSPALKAVLDDIHREQCDRVFMLGDVINGFDPHGSVELLRSWSSAHGVKMSCIKGNAESYLLTPDRSSLPRQDGDLNRSLIPLIQWFEDHLSPSDLDWLSSFADILHWEDAYLVHDSPQDRFLVENQSDPELKPEHREWFFHGHGIYPDMNKRENQVLLEFMEKENLRQVFCGHTHIPFVREFDEKVVCNVGSVGVPLDGDPRPSWVLFENNSSKEPVIYIRRVMYDIRLIHQLVDATPDYPDFQSKPYFKEAYKTWLSTGIHWKAHVA